MSIDKEASDTSKFFSRNPEKWESQSKKIFRRKDLISASGLIMTIDNHTDPEFDDQIMKLTDEESIELIDYLLLQEKVGKDLEKELTTSDGLVMTWSNYGDPVFLPLLNKLHKNYHEHLLPYLNIKKQKMMKPKTKLDLCADTEKTVEGEDSEKSKTSKVQDVEEMTNNFEKLWDTCYHQV
jgi:hypothetical protein